MKSIGLYSEEQIRAAEQYLKDVGADDLSLDSRHGQGSRAETIRVFSPDGRDSRVLKGVYLDGFAKDRLALIVPRYTHQLPRAWAVEGVRLILIRRYADETLGIRQIIEGLVAKAMEAKRENDPEGARVLIMQIDRQRRFEPGENLG